jgi:hypothetical protein
VQVRKFIFDAPQRKLRPSKAQLRFKLLDVLQVATFIFSRLFFFSGLQLL